MLYNKKKEGISQGEKAFIVSKKNKEWTFIRINNYEVDNKRR